MPIYNKLVRDNIPAVIEKAGKTCQTKILNEQEYIQELKTKLKEELKEYLTSNTDQEAIHELADMLEVIHVLTDIHNSSVEELESIRLQKNFERGGFQERVFLIEVHE